MEFYSHHPGPDESPPPRRKTIQMAVKPPNTEWCFHFCRFGTGHEFSHFVPATAVVDEYFQRCPDHPLTERERVRGEENEIRRRQDTACSEFAEFGD